MRRPSSAISSLRIGWVYRRDHVFELGDDLLLLFVGQLVEVVRDLLGDLLLAIRLRVREDLLAAVAHAFEAAAHGVDGRGHAALQHRHREADGAARGPSRPARLSLDWSST